LAGLDPGYDVVGEFTMGRRFTQIDADKNRKTCIHLR
jgi:hypothetical protein